MNEIKNRLKSPVVWSCALAQVLLIIGLFMPEISDPIKIIGTAVIELATIFGLLNNPAERSSF